MVIWVICCFMGYVGYLWLLSTILYIYMYVFGMFYPQSLFKHSTILLVYYGSRIPGPHKND